MARLPPLEGKKRGRKPVTSDIDLRLKAFDLYVTLDRNFQRINSTPDIAKQLKIERKKLDAWIDNEGWSKKLSAAIEKAREVSEDPDVQQEALANFLYEKNAPVEIGVDPGKAIKYYEEKKKKRLDRTIKYAGDIIYEARAYNRMLIRALMAKKNQPKVVIPIGSRIDIHKAWQESTKILLDLFGVQTIRELAMELSKDFNTRAAMLREKDGGGTKVQTNIFLGGDKNPAQMVADGNTVIVLDDSSHELILHTMVGETSVEIPREYKGPKEHDKSVTSEIVGQVRIDKEGEE